MQPARCVSALSKGGAQWPQTCAARAGRVDVGGEVTARDIIVATGSVPFVPPGIPIDGKTVFTSDHALKLEWVPNWVAIIGSGYIGLEFSDVYTALGSEVTFIEARPRRALASGHAAEARQSHPCAVHGMQAVHGWSDR